MKRLGYKLYLILLIFGVISCSNEKKVSPTSIEENCGTEAALATCLSPKFDSAYYIEQGIKYWR